MLEKDTMVSAYAHYSITVIRLGSRPSLGASKFRGGGRKQIRDLHPTKRYDGASLISLIGWARKGWASCLRESIIERKTRKEVVQEGKRERGRE